MTATDVALLLLAASVLAAMVRVVRGPTSADRVVAAELVFIASVGAVVLVAIRTDLPVLLDIALVAVLGGFVATVSLSRLVSARGRGPLREEES